MEKLTSLTDVKKAAYDRLLGSNSAGARSAFGQHNRELRRQLIGKGGLNFECD